MRGEMQMRNGPWVWWIFGASMALYAAGFAALGSVGPVEHIVLGCYLALGVAAALTYYTAFSEVKDLVLIKSLGEYAARRQWGPFSTQAPLWLLSLVLAALCCQAGLAERARLVAATDWTYAEGGFELSDRPGLGVVVDGDAVARYTVPR